MKSISQKRLDEMIAIADASADVMEIYMQAQKSAIRTLKERRPELSSEKVNAIVHKIFD